MFSRRSFFANLLRAAAVSAAMHYAPRALIVNTVEVDWVEVFSAMKEEFARVLFYGEPPRCEFVGFDERFFDE